MTKPCGTTRGYGAGCRCDDCREANREYQLNWRTSGGAYELPKRDPMQRFMESVDQQESGCWIWTGSCMPHGYAKFFVDRKTRIAHRWIYEQMRGPIPEGMHIDHLCRVRNCVNPDHLEVVTQRENLWRGHLSRGPLARSFMPAK